MAFDCNKMKPSAIQTQLEKGCVTIADHPSDEIHPKTLKSILRQA
jgi:predicted RNA binding protein YcfA (HicA-like mRNA interferase family)